MEHLHRLPIIQPHCSRWVPNHLDSINDQFVRPLHSTDNFSSGIYSRFLIVTHYNSPPPYDSQKGQTENLRFQFFFIPSLPLFSIYFQHFNYLSLIFLRNQRKFSRCQSSIPHIYYICFRDVCNLRFLVSYYDNSHIIGASSSSSICGRTTIAKICYNISISLRSGSSAFILIILPSISRLRYIEFRRSLRGHSMRMKLV